MCSGLGQVVDRNEHRDLRVIHRRNADEGRGVAVFGVKHIAFVVILRQNLRRRGLAADAITGHISVFARAAFDNRKHCFTHISRGLLRDDLPNDSRLGRRLNRTIRPEDLLDDIRLLELAVINDRADHVDHLDRGDLESLTK